MKKANKRFFNNLLTYGMVAAAFLICEAMISGGHMTRSLKGQLVPICCWIVMAVSLNLSLIHI